MTKRVTARSGVDPRGAANRQTAQPATAATTRVAADHVIHRVWGVAESDPTAHRGRSRQRLVDLDPRVRDVVQSTLRIFFEAPLSSRWTLDGVSTRERAPVGLAFEDRRDVSDTVAPGNAMRPVSNSKSTHPNAQMSARLSTDCPRACSGLMYAAVPSRRPRAFR